MVEAGPENYNRAYYDKMGEAGYASVSRSSGYWTILRYQGVPYVGIQYNSGASSSAPLSQVMGGNLVCRKGQVRDGLGKRSLQVERSLCFSAVSFHHINFYCV